MSDIGSKVLIVILFAGGSLFSFDVTSEPIKITVADLAVGSVMALLLITHKTIEINLVAILFGLLAVVSLVSGAYNLIFADEFFVGNFAIHFLRLIGMVVALMVLPTLLRKADAQFIIKTLVWTVVVHIVAVVAHQFGVLPFPANPYSYMVAGFFNEPSWYGVWVFLALATVLQYEWNISRYLTTIWVSVAAFATAFVVHSGSQWTPIRASISPVLLVSLALGGATALRMRTRFLINLSHRSQGFILAGTGLSLLLFSFLALLIAPKLVSESNEFGMSVNSLRNRVFNVLQRPEAQAEQDSSVNLQVYGAWELALKSSGDSPIFGTGLGGDNLIRVYEKHRSELKYVYKFGKISIGQTPPEILRATGVLGLMVLMALYIVLLTKVRWAMIGGALIIVSFFWGDPFSTMLWPFFALCIALMPRKVFRWPKRSQLRDEDW